MPGIFFSLMPFNLISSRVKGMSENMIPGIYMIACLAHNRDLKRALQVDLSVSPSPGLGASGLCPAKQGCLVNAAVL
jgi:hypothetical protein